MTPLLVGLAVVALIAAMLLLSRRSALTVGPGRRASDPAGGPVPEEWLAAAHDVTASGDSLLADIGWPASARAAASSVKEATATDDPRSPQGRLARLVRESAALTASAPTTMDARVCRNLSVRAKALETALENDTPSVHHKLEDFATALGDMKDHVDLL